MSRHFDFSPSFAADRRTIHFGPYGDDEKINDDVSRVFLPTAETESLVSRRAHNGASTMNSIVANFWASSDTLGLI